VPYEVAQEVGRLRSTGRLEDYPMDAEAAEAARAYLDSQTGGGAPMPTDRLVTIESEGRVMVINACFGSRVNETLGKLVAALIMSRQGASLQVNTDAYRIVMQLSRPMDATAVRKLLLDTAPSSVESLLRLYLKHSSYLRWKFITVAKKFGALKRNADYRMLNLDKVMQSLEGTPLMEEALEKCMWELLDPAKAAEVLGDMQSGKIEVRVSGLSPIGKAGIEAHGDIMMPARPTHAILMAMKSRLEKETAVLACMHCRRKSVRSVGLVEDRVVCRSCGSVMVAAIRRSEAENVRLLEKRSPTKEEKRSVQRMMKSANLVMTHGRRAVLAMAARGVGPDTAAKILAMQFDEEDDFLAAILAAEITFARTKKFWE